ncbi:hypothetical protein C6495_18935 [Candidatus Poribacteria bacterium]|nr:MAG: hypothetical protein C6495_18935 [Candidatus Poribacteria bacterium]
MWRTLISNRLVVVGILFCLLSIAGSLFYSWHVEHGLREEEARIKQFLQQLETPTEEVRMQQTAEPAGLEKAGQADAPFPGTDLAQMDTEPAKTFGTEDVEVVDADTALFSDETSETDAAPVSPYGVSPYGFGPFPEPPPDYPDQGVWDEVRIRSMQPEHELLSRVRIKLWTQGIHTGGAVFKSDYGLIYLLLPDVVYIEWDEYVDENGQVHRYVSRQLSAPETADRYEADIGKGIFSPTLTIYEFPYGGIDPYEFLGLPR